MSDAAQRGGRTAELADLVLGFAESSPEVREIAVFDAAGSQLTSTDGHDWHRSAARLWRAAEGPEGAAGLSWVHVGTEDGEVLAVRSQAGSAIALTDRFALAALVLSDLRAALRLLGSEGEAR